MKKYLYLLFVITALFSCSKEAQTPDNLRQQMVDSWFYRSAYVINYSAKGQPLDSTRIITTNKDFFEFKEDGSFTNSTVNGQEITTGTFNTATTSTFVIKESGVNHTCRVISLNLENFIFAVPEGTKVAGQPYTETKLTLFR